MPSGKVEHLSFSPWGPFASLSSLLGRDAALIVLIGSLGLPSQSEHPGDWQVNGKERTQQREEVSREPRHHFGPGHSANNSLASLLILSRQQRGREEGRRKPQKRGMGVRALPLSLPVLPPPHPRSYCLRPRDGLFAHKSEWDDEQIIWLAENDWLIRK